ncbi:tetratricopeptide repeat protein [Ruegeria arenilitoris]|uniref:tetratricopeptide repeat protein n=2 Tax=Ruegeria arenilitoris TaxID=1173585 RepID=UPI00147F1D2A|nr:tetratricopeptide repeat protein [Ruegeria arenilitoris]
MSVTRFAISKGLAVVFLAATLLMSACDSAEERAEAHYQAGLAYLEKGEVERALIEFKNVFKLNSQHKEARLTLARLERERGNVSIAYSQYLQLVEQYPDNFEGHRALSEMALETENWEDLRRYAGVAKELAPNDIEIQSLNNTLAYTEAVEAKNTAEADLTVNTAYEILNDRPDLMSARQIVIDDLVRSQDWATVLSEADTALSFAPQQDKLYDIRLRALQELHKPEEIEKQLMQMLQIFPEDTSVQQRLFEHYVNQKQLDAAEGVLRDQAEPEAPDPLSIQRLIAFLEEYRGTDAAIAELDDIIALGGINTPRFKTMRAVLKFQLGDTQTALGEMQELLENAERTTQTRESEVEFARMLLIVGKPQEGRAVIEQILTDDPTQTEAVKLKAAWLIEEDKIDDAIVLLRKALHATPRDSQLMTLMARAHERDGDRELMGEMLALATEVSRNAPEETLNYARHLIAEENLKVAERVLNDALYQNPENSELLLALGSVYLNLQNWERLEAALNTVRNLDDPNARQRLDELRAQMLSTQKRMDELAAFLEELANDPEFGLSADIALIRLMLTQGDVTGAIERLDELLMGNPNSLALRFVKARALTSENKLEDAEQLYRAILRDRPEATRAWLALFSLQVERERPEQAQSVLNEAVIVLPEDPDILMLQATEYERAGKLDQAITVYEKLYPISNRSLVVANNLANLLTTHRHDDESLQRAQHLVQRLRGTRIPAYQDTYGWVAYRLGNYEQALIYLEPAARALPDQPLVLYHLGKTYAAVDRPQDALRAFRAAQETGVPLNVIPTLETEIKQLSAASIAGQ